MVGSQRNRKIPPSRRVLSIDTLSPGETESHVELMRKEKSS